MSTLIIDLWCQVVLEFSETVDFELDDKGVVLGHVEVGKRRQSTGLVEQVEIVQGELLLYLIFNLDLDLVLGL